jgi:ADP-heptose:LPS heptosyltransferase
MKTGMKKDEVKEFFVTLLGALLFTPLKNLAFSRLKAVQNICFINLGAGLGDHLLFYPIIRVFRQQYPSAKITLITEPKFNGIKGLFPEINEVITLDLKNLSFKLLLSTLRKGHFDALLLNYDMCVPTWILSLAIGFSGIPIRIGCNHNGLRQKVLTKSVPNMIRNTEMYVTDGFYLLAEAFFTLVNRSVEPDLMSLLHQQISPQALTEAVKVLSAHGEGSSKPKIIIHPGTSKESKAANWTKSWPPAYWKQLITQLLAQYARGELYLVGGPDDEKEIAAIDAQLTSLPEHQKTRFINLYGKIGSIECLAALMSLCDVFIGCDSFAMHLALSVGCPLVAIFSLTNEKRFLPLSNPKCLVATREDLSCRPCMYITRTESCDEPICLNVPVETVLEKIKIHLQAYSNTSKPYSQHKPEPVGS